jgi:polyvinyl alcohol dehydrogenase (cytochrome)
MYRLLAGAAALALACTAVLAQPASPPASNAPPPGPPPGPPPNLRMGLGVQGEILFDAACAGCHVRFGEKSPAARAPVQETLRQFPPERIYEALTSGKMQVQGARLSDQDRRDVAEWLSARRLGAAAAGDARTMQGRCKSGGAAAASGPSWNGWSPGHGNARFQEARAAGLTAADLPTLKLKWAFGLPGGVEAYSQPTVAGGRVYVGSDSGQIYALDAGSGCVHWSFLAGAGVRTAPVLARLGARQALFIGDMKANLYALDASSGALIWTARADDQPLTRITDTPAVAGGRLYVGTSSSEEISGLQASYECCRNRGTVSAFDAATGKRIWKFYTLEPARVLGKKPDGRRIWGPAGVSVWASPTVDLKRGLLYVATGDSFTEPAAPLSDAIVALSLKTGKVVWSHQETKGDAYMTGCEAPGPNCPQGKNGPDYDFASSAVLQTLKSGRQVLVAGHKGGGVVALDPDNRGAVLWRVMLAKKSASARGDIVYGGAADHGAAYFALQETAALTALDLATGRTLWQTPVAPPPDRADRVGSAAAVSAIPGVVFSGGWDGVLRAYDSASGRPIWSYDTVRPFQTVNGVEAKGGSMGAPGVSVSGGMLYVGSGYVGISSGMPGNVILAFGK